MARPGRGGARAGARETGLRGDLGVTAAAIAVYWRRALYGLIASRMYLAWCAAAIVLPVAAGRLFDLTQSYGIAILIAAAGNALGVFVALGLPRQRAVRAGAQPRGAEA